MNGLRYRIYRFMQGRRGIDQFGRFLLITALALMFLSMFLGRIPAAYYITYYLGLAVFIYGYYRAFSRNLYKREMENNRYLALKYRVTGGKSFQQRRYERKYYAYFKCPGCGQKMRAPKGKGTIRVKCHTCNTEFQKKV
ncbi:MAG: hypothetical protein ACI4LA_04125 [Emergencia sp.]